MAEKKKVRKMKPFTTAWHQEAYQLLRNSFRIRACGLCGHPAIDGYVCPVCYGDDSVDKDEE